MTKEDNISALLTALREQKRMGLKGGIYHKTQIDLLVYHLYGLTYDEALIVDPETPITREDYNNNSIN